MFGGNAFVTEEDISLFNATRDTTKWSSAMRAKLLPVYGADKLQVLWSGMRFKKARFQPNMSCLTSLPCAGWCDAMEQSFVGGGSLCVEELPNITAKTLILHGLKVGRWAASLLARPRGARIK